MEGQYRIVRPGDTLGDGRYLLEERLGEGGMAVVHRGRDTALNRAVAVKTMSPAFAHEEAHRRRFRREARAVAGLGHPHVVAVHDVGEEPGPPPVPYLVMELLTGRSLDKVLAADGRMPLPQALRLTSEVLSALDASHQHGIVHRDIKPGNVMVGEDGSAKVMDFGIVRALGQSDGTHIDLTRTEGVVAGTPHFMSPEQFESPESVDGRSDLYSVGVMLFRMLTGTVPFDGGSGYFIGYKHCTEPPPQLAQRGAHVPLDVEDLVRTALQKRPADRYPDARTMRMVTEHLRDALDESSRPATPPPAHPYGAAAGAAGAGTGAAAAQSAGTPTPAGAPAPYGTPPPPHPHPQAAPVPPATPPPGAPDPTPGTGPGTGPGPGPGPGFGAVSDPTPGPGSVTGPAHGAVTGAGAGAGAVTGPGHDEGAPGPAPSPSPAPHTPPPYSSSGNLRTTPGLRFRAPKANLLRRVAPLAVLATVAALLGQFRGIFFVLGIVAVLFSAIGLYVLVWGTGVLGGFPRGEGVPGTVLRRALRTNDLEPLAAPARAGRTGGPDAAPDTAPGGGDRRRALVAVLLVLLFITDFFIAF